MWFVRILLVYVCGENTVVGLGMGLIFDEHHLDIVWHACFTCMLVIIPFDGHAAEKGATPVN